MKRILVLVVGLLLLGVNVYAANGDLTVNGTINVGSGGVMFPDGSTQTTAISPTTQNNVTASRALGTVYRNTTGKPMSVKVLLVATVTTTDLWVDAFTDTSASPTTLVDSIQLNTAFNPTPIFRISVSFIVLPGNYYQVVNQRNSSLLGWLEWY